MSIANTFLSNNLWFPLSLIRAPEYLLRSEYQDSECFPKQIQTYYSTSFSQTLSAVCKPFVVPLPLSLRPVLRLTAASESCPTETLDPDDENLSYYQYDFSQQYRALWSIDFPRGNVWIQDHLDVYHRETDLKLLKPWHLQNVTS